MEKVSYDVVNNVTTAKINFQRKKSWEKWFLLSSDRHFDHPKSDRDLQTYHLNQLKERGGHLIDNGDLFCFMQGKFDKRGSKSSVKDIYNNSTHFDSIIDDASDYFAKYKEQLFYFGVGNHEYDIKNRAEWSPLRRFSDTLELKHGCKNFVVGDYSSYIKLKFECGDGNRQSINLFLHHGFGGNAPQTKGLLPMRRMQETYPDADVIMTGHTHTQFLVPIKRYRLDRNGKTYYDNQYLLKTPTYKDEFDKGRASWGTKKGFAPAPLGAWWLKFYYNTYYNKIMMDFSFAD